MEALFSAPTPSDGSSQRDLAGFSTVAVWVELVEKHLPESYQRGP